MANEKELTELYSGPGAESFRVFEDENGRVRATMGRGEIVTATPSAGGGLDFRVAHCRPCESETACYPLSPHAGGPANPLSRGRF